MIHKMIILFKYVNVRMVQTNSQRKMSLCKMFYRINVLAPLDVTKIWKWVFPNCLIIGIFENSAWTNVTKLFMVVIYDCAE
jgi:hypothetical protein